MDVSFTNVLEGARQYFQGLPSASGPTGPYCPQNVPQEQNQRQQQPAQQHQPSQQQQHQQQHMAQPVYYHHQTNELYADSGSNHGAAAATATSTNHWHQQQQSAADSRRTPSTPVQRAAPSQHSSTNSRPPSHSSQYQDIRQYSQYTHSQDVAPSFQFTRPHSREQSNQSSYYQQSYQQPSSPHVSREQLTTPVSQYQQPVPPRIPTSTVNHQYAYRSYYPTQAAQPVVSKPESGYLPVNQQYQQQKQQTYQATQSYRASTHNLPPIAALSNYHATKTQTTKSVPKVTTSTYPTQAIQHTNRARTDQYYQPASNSYGYQPTSTMNQKMSSVITPTNSNVIMTTANSYVTNQNHQNHMTVAYQQPPQKNQMPNYQSVNTSVIKQRKESPLDLSVKTVKSSADSTEGESKSRLNHNYPTVDIEKSFSQRSQMPQTATAPKVEFHPNFNLQSSRHSGWTVDEAAKPKPAASTYVQYPNDYLMKSFPRHAYDAAKRPGQVASPAIPTKIPKMDNWRESINMQIEEKFTSHYKQQQMQQQQQRTQSVVHKAYDGTTSVALLNENQIRGVSSPYNYQHYKQPYGRMVQQPQYPNSIIKSSYVPSSSTNHYQNYYNKPGQMYINPAAARPPTVKPINSAGADKRVLSLLRSSIEIKEQKKIELQKSQDLTQLSDIQYPTTDVTAPLQPKPGIDRNNVSPFTPISVPDPNVCKMPPKIIVPPIEDLKPSIDEQGTVIINNEANDYDGLAAFLAARIRTKGELKDLSHQVNNNATREARLHAFLEDTIKSPHCSSNIIPPKLLKDKSAFVPRKRLFSRNEDEPGKLDMPRREKSTLRSSSETSVFDFPDSEDENEMPVLERQTLGAMRKDRRNSLKQPMDSDQIKVEFDSRPTSPEDDFFKSICDRFVDQLRNKPTRRIKRAINNIKTELFEEVQVKIEIEDSPEIPVLDAELLNSCTPAKSIIDSDSDLSESEIKSDERLMVQNKHRVRRKILSSSDTSDNEDSKVKSEDPQLDIKVEKEEPDKKSTNVISIAVRPAKKPSFGDGSDFYPGWEEGVYKYKRSLRMPPSLIQLTRPPNRLSTSLPDLDPCPQSPTTSTTDVDSIVFKREIKRLKSEPDSDSESTSSFNIFSKKTNYDSEGSSSIKSLPNTRRENISILDKLLEKCGGKKRRNRRKDDLSPKVIPKADNQVELLATPTPGLELSASSPEKSKGLIDPIINTTTAVLPFREDTVNHFKDAFINSGNNILAVHDKFTTIVLSSRTRKETRAMKQRATIKEVFGEDRPASAPPVTCVNQMKMKVVLEPFSKNLEEILIKREKINQQSERNDGFITPTKIKKEIVDDDDEEEEDHKKLIDLVVKRDPDACSETMSLDSEETGLTVKRKNKFGKIRRKLSSGFDYLRKKKKVKKDDSESGSVERKRRKGPPGKAPESIDDIQKEIKSWVLNKGIGESHLHRAARLGFVDVTAYCLDRMDCPPGPKDNAGYTPLHEACARGHLEIARLLLKYGANVQEAAKGGIRPLHEAIENGFVEIVRLLLSYGADPYLATYAGLTPISLACEDYTRNFLKDHMRDKAGEGGVAWYFHGPSSCFDLQECGFNVLADPPQEDTDRELEDLEIDLSEALLPNLYTLRGEPSTDRWILLQDLSHYLKIKSRDALLKQISSTSSSVNVKTDSKNVLKELKMSDFLEQAHCCQFLNMGEKLNTRASKIALVKYTDRVKELLGVETMMIESR